MKFFIFNIQLTQLILIDAYIGFLPLLQTAYIPAQTKSLKVFLATYLGLNVPLILLQCLGACVQVGAKAIPAWSDGYAAAGLGGLLDAVMHPLKGFRKVVLVRGRRHSHSSQLTNTQVILALGISSNNAPTIYSCALTLQTFLPQLVCGESCVFSTCLPVTHTHSHTPQQFPASSCLPSPRASTCP